MKIISFNANGIRARLHQLDAMIERHNPDVIGIQETKVADDHFPLTAVEQLGYQVHFHGQKSHYGVALLTRDPVVAVHKGLPMEDENAQRRFISVKLSLAENRCLHILNGYFPQGDNRTHETKFPNKEQFYKNITQLLSDSYQPDDLLILMGDFNIAIEDRDIGIGEDNRKRWLRTGKCSFLPEEREWIQRLMAWGLKDTYRVLHPDNEDQFSWFDYRSRGFEREPKRGLRIDTLLATHQLAEKITEVGIDYELRRMEKPSDHCPVWATFNL